MIVNPRQAVAGTKAVKKGLTDLEKKANKTQLAIQKVFAGLTVIFAITQLAQLGDAFTNLQNRLRVVTDGQEELIIKTEELLQVANRSRSSFESTAELYSRLALATRELSLEGANLVKITESINKAIILSGASAKEANNGLIQLSQGLASGRLTGDELRSTLEQLPVVADVIAKQMGVTRGELRALGAQGKITSIQIIRAFQAAEGELEAKFAKTVPTLSQSFVVLRNNVVAFVGRINEGTGILRGFGNAIRFIGTELATVVKTLALIGATAGAIKLAPVIQSFFKMQAAVRAGNAVLLKSGAAIKLRTAFLAEQAATAVVAAGAEVVRTEGIIAQARAETIAATVGLSRNKQILAIAATEQALLPVQAQLIAQTNALTAADLRLAAAQKTAAASATVLSRALTRLKIAVIALNKAIAANLIGIFVVAVAAAVAALVIFRNSIKLTKDGLGTLGDFFAEFFESVKIALSVLGDFFSDAFEPLVTAVKDALGIIEFEFADLIRVPALFIDRTIGFFLGLGALIGAAISNLPAVIGNIFVKAVNFVISVIEDIPQAFIGVLKTVGQVVGIFFDAVGRSFEQLQVSFDLAKAGDFAGAAKFFRQSKDTIGRAFDEATTGLGDRLRENIASEVEKEVIPRIPELATSMGDVLHDALNKVADAADFSGVRDFAEGLLSGAEARGADRAAEEATKAKAEADKAAATAAAGRAEAIAKVLGPLAEENRLLGISIAEGAREAEIQRQLTKVREALAKAGQKLSIFQALATEALIRQNAARKEAISTASGLQAAEQILIERLRELQNAYDQGTISVRVFNEAQREAELQALESSKNFADGWEAAIERAIDKLSDFGQTASDIVGTLIPGLVDSLGDTFQAGFSFIAKSLTDSETSWVDYREAIKATFKGLIDDLLAQLARLLAQKALFALLDPSGTSGSVAGIAGALDGAAHGTTAATANKPFVVGEEGPEIFTPGQTGSITPTDQTIEALTGGAANNRETIVVQAPAPEVNLQTVVVDDPSKIPAAIQSPDGRQAVRNVIREERSGIKRDLG